MKTLFELATTATVFFFRHWDDKYLIFDTPIGNDGHLIWSFDRSKGKTSFQSSSLAFIDDNEQTSLEAIETITLDQAFTVRKRVFIMWGNNAPEEAIIFFNQAITAIKAINDLHISTEKPK